MNEIIYFNTKKLLDKNLFEQFLQHHFTCKAFVWISNFYNFFVDNEIVITNTYISLEISTGGFKYQYSIFKNINLNLSLRQSIALLKKLSNELNIEILSTDDEINPWSRVYIEPNGQTSTVETFTPDDLIIKAFYNFPFGDFRTKEKLNELEIVQLKNLIKNIYSDIKIEYATDGPIINGEFNKIKNNVEKLKGFNHHYSVTPVGKTNWLDKEEKSTQFILIMDSFRKIIQKNLCIFPRNFSVVKNIEGGSDSEDFCILITPFGQEKIIYKQRRNSWRS